MDTSSTSWSAYILRTIFQNYFQLKQSIRQVRQESSSHSKPSAEEGSWNDEETAFLALGGEWRFKKRAHYDGKKNIAESGMEDDTLVGKGRFEGEVFVKDGRDCALFAHCLCPHRCRCCG